MKILFLTLALLSYAVTSFADVTLNLPFYLNILAVNGKNANIHSTAHLPNGINQIAVRYQKEFGRSFNEVEMEYSDVFVVKFESFDEELTLKIPRIKSREDLEAFNDQPGILIVTNSGKTIENHIAKLEKEGLQFMRNYAQELMIFNTTNSPAAIKTDRSEPSVPKQESNEPVQMNRKPSSKQMQDHSSVGSTASAMELNTKDAGQEEAGQQTVLAEEMLKYWYQQADEQTRNKFRKWISR